MVKGNGPFKLKNDDGFPFVKMLNLGMHLHASQSLIMCKVII